MGENVQFLSRAIQIVSRVFLGSKIVTGEILRHWRFFPKLARGGKKVSRMKEKNTGKNISKNVAFFSGISV